MARFSRLVGGRDFFSVHLQWQKVCHDVLEAVKKWDFCDALKKELPEVLATRLRDVEAVLQKRGKAYSTPTRCAAMILDARLMEILESPDPVSQAGFDLPAVHQRAVAATVNQFLPLFWQGTACEQAKAALDMYLNKTGEFSAIDYPNRFATKQMLVDWWRNQQPNYMLKKVALHVAALSGGQGAARV